VQEEFRQSRTMTEFSPLEDRLPPQNIEAEEAVLGGILMDSEALTRVADIYRAALLLNAQGLPTDLMSVTTYLEDNGFLEKVGGKSALRRLVESLVNTVNIDQYARLIADKYTRRQLIRGGQEVVALGYDTAQDITLTLDQAEQKIFAVTQERVTRSVVPASDILLDIFESLEQRFTEGAEIPGIASSFYDLDSLTQGFQPSDLIIVAGRPSMGKTSLCLSIGHNITQKANLPVVVFSLEMSKEQLVQRLLSSEAEIDSHRLRSGRISENEWQKVGTAIGRLASSPLFIDDTPNATVMEMRSKCRRLMAEQGGRLGMIIIDYLQLMEGSSDNRVQELSKITRGLKGLGRELKVPVMALSQLSRAVEARTNKRPMLSDLRESGSIEQDADLVMMVYRDEYYNADSPDRGIAEVILSKHRNGPTGTVKLLFEKQFARFKNLA
jgi:replicative DNA helicase